MDSQKTTLEEIRETNTRIIEMLRKILKCQQEGLLKPYFHKSLIDVIWHYNDYYDFYDYYEQ